MAHPLKLASNPAWPGYCADPHVIRHQGIYYAYGTRDGGERKFTLLRSRDLQSWENLGGALEPVPGVTSDEYWAPEVAYAQGKFWMYFSCPQPHQGEMLQRLRVAAANSPEGPFLDCGKLLLPNEGFTIDASPFCDPKSGQWYLYFARDFLEGRVGTGTAVVPLADSMTAITGEVRPVAIPSADWQISSRNRTMYGQLFPEWHTVEGAHVVFHDSRYYCFYSGGDWQGALYGVAYAVADHPLGPWHDEGTLRGPCVLKAEGKTIGPGHNSVVLAPDDQTSLCVYHAWDEAHVTRQLCLDPIEWMANGPRVRPTH